MKRARDMLCEICLRLSLCEKKWYALPTIWPDDKILIKRSPEVKKEKNRNFASLWNGEKCISEEKDDGIFFLQTGKVKVQCSSGSIVVKSRHIEFPKRIQHANSRSRSNFSARCWKVSIAHIYDFLLNLQIGRSKKINISFTQKWRNEHDYLHMFRKGRSFLRILNWFFIFIRK